MTQTPSHTPQRATPETFRARSMNASLTVKDLPKSLGFYSGILGFTIEQKYEREGKLVAASLKAGDVAILLNQDDGAKGWDRIKGVGFSLQFNTAQDLDALAKGIKSRGGTLDMEPADMPWGARIFRLHDIDGYHLVFSSDRA